MSEPFKNRVTVLDDDGALSRRIAAWRAAKESPTTGNANTDLPTATTPSSDPVATATTPASASVQHRLSHRIADRRTHADASSVSGGQEEGGSGSIGQHIAREPLFVGAAFPLKNPGALDKGAPPLKSNTADRTREKLGAPDPQPPRARKFKP